MDISYGLEDFGIGREWNYFCSCHGKGRGSCCVRTQGGSTRGGRENEKRRLTKDQLSSDSSYGSSFENDKDESEESSYVSDSVELSDVSILPKSNTGRKS